MRLLLALAASFFLATFAPLSLYRDPVAPERSVLQFTPIPLNTKEGGERRLGRLVYLGGWEIRSNDQRFGGISAMHVDQGRVTAFSDTGALFRFDAPPTTARAVEIFPLPEGPGSGERKSDRDIEAAIVHEDRGWIAFERRNAVWRYRQRDWRREASAQPAAMRRWQGNSGPEAMVRLRDGRFLIISEGGSAADWSTEALLFKGDPAVALTPAERLRYRAPEGYRVTDAALLDDGSILFLNRAFGLFRGFTAKLTLAERPDFAAGSTIQGREIAHFEAPVSTDNLEALSVTVQDGRTILWIASDDNLNPLQRTILLKFSLDR